MGYYTKYNLNIISEDVHLLEEAKKKIYEISEYNDFNDTIKWYDHEDDMKELSEIYPETVFELSGEGEDNGDIWKKYFLNGKMQIAKAKIVLSEFDPNELK